MAVWAIRHLLRYLNDTWMRPDTSLRYLNGRATQVRHLYNIYLFPILIKWAKPQRWVYCVYITPLKNAARSPFKVTFQNHINFPELPGSHTPTADVRARRGTCFFISIPCRGHYSLFIKRNKMCNTMSLLLLVNRMHNCSENIAYVFY